MGELLYQELSYKVRAVLYEVHTALGPGFREETYKQAVLAELRRRQIKFEREFPIRVMFKDEEIDQYRLDIVVEDKIILELKALANLLPLHTAQLVSYLRASGLQVGLLVNFGTDNVQIIRRVNSLKSAYSAKSA